MRDIGTNTHIFAWESGRNLYVYMNKIFKDIHLIIILNGGSSIIIPNAWFKEHRKRTVLRQENNHIAVLRNLQKKRDECHKQGPFYAFGIIYTVSK